MKAAEAGREVHIGKVVRNALIFNPRNPDSTLLEHLFSLLEERRIDYLLVGGIAMVLYVDVRSTDKIEFIMAASSLDQLPEIRKVGQEDDFVRGSFDGLQIDLLLTSNPLFEKARRQYATRQRFREREIPCATPEGLVLLKLYALPSLYRQGNFTRVALYETDILTLMHRYGIDAAPLFEELEGHLSDTDLASLRQIADEIRRKIERFGGGMFP